MSHKSKIKIALICGQDYATMNCWNVQLEMLRNWVLLYSVKSFQWSWQKHYYTIKYHWKCSNVGITAWATQQHEEYSCGQRGNLWAIGGAAYLLLCTEGNICLMLPCGNSKKKAQTDQVISCNLACFCFCPSEEYPVVSFCSWLVNVFNSCRMKLDDLFL